MLNFIISQVIQKRNNYFQKTNNNINMFWSGPAPTPLHWACVNSFAKNGFKITLYSYDLHREEIPISNVELKNARTIVPEEEIFYFDNPVTRAKDMGPFCDYFRIKMLYLNGGWYVDVDTLCLNNKLPTSERCWANEGAEYDNSATNGVLKFPKGDTILEILLREIEKINPQKNVLESRGLLGPRLFNRVLKENNFPSEQNATKNDFYPIGWHEMFKLYLPEFFYEVSIRSQNSIFLSLYHSWFSYAGIDFGAVPPKGSYMRNVHDNFLLGNGRSNPDRKELDVNFCRYIAGRWLKENGWAQDLLQKYSHNMNWRNLIK